MTHSLTDPARRGPAAHFLWGNVGCIAQEVQNVGQLDQRISNPLHKICIGPKPRNARLLARKTLSVNHVLTRECARSSCGSCDLRTGIAQGFVGSTKSRRAILNARSAPAGRAPGWPESQPGKAGWTSRRSCDGPEP